MSNVKIGSIILRVLSVIAVLLIMVVVGTAIYIFLPTSAVGKTVIVPDVTGKHLINATNILCKSKLRVNKIYEEHSLEKNYIISQDPLPGTKVKSGRTIDLKVSMGNSMVIRVPNLQNIPLTEAKHHLNRLSNQKLQTGQISYIYSSVEKDYVIAQSPLPKTKLPENSKINLLISLGNRPLSFYMPELTGMKLDEATELVKKIGLRITRIREEISTEYERGTIINQKPLYGYRVTIGDGLTLTVANK
ncbi:MAG: PASTA domain-containing protein [bacterium]